MSELWIIITDRTFLPHFPHSSSPDGLPPTIEFSTDKCSQFKLVPIVLLSGDHKDSVRFNIYIFSATDKLHLLPLLISNNLAVYRFLYSEDIGVSVHFRLSKTSKSICPLTMLTEKKFTRRATVGRNFTMPSTTQLCWLILAFSRLPRLLCTETRYIKPANKLWHADYSSFTA